MPVQLGVVLPDVMRPEVWKIGVPVPFSPTTSETTTGPFCPTSAQCRCPAVITSVPVALSAYSISVPPGRTQNIPSPVVEDVVAAGTSFMPFRIALNVLVLVVPYEYVCASAGAATKRTAATIPNTGTYSFFIVTKGLELISGISS